jgi:GxxExxY protein
VVKGLYTFEDASREVIEAAIEVHKCLGPGFLEAIYERALRIALQSRDVPCETQKEVTIQFRDQLVGLHRLDLIANSEIVVEIKAVKAFEDIHFAQLRSYLKATKLEVGLLLNFNSLTLAIKRVVLTHH